MAKQTKAKASKFIDEEVVPAIDLIKAEADRISDQSGENFTADHDDISNANGQLAAAAAAYVIPPAFRHPVGMSPAIWPWGKEWWKPNTLSEDLEVPEDYLRGRIRELTKSGALIVKEIGRLQRLISGTNFVPEQEGETEE